MEIQQNGNLYVVPCREWAAVHLGRDITYEYRSKRNALRAATDPKRNTVTMLCYYAMQLFERVAVLETLLLRIKKTTERYDFDDVESIIGNGAVSDEHDTGSSAVDTESGGRIGGSEGAVACSGGGDEGANCCN